MLKKFFILTLLINIIWIMSIASFAINLTEMENAANGFINTGAEKATDLSSVTTAVSTEFSGLGSILTTIGAGILVAVTTYMGVKYIVSPPDKQAALKQQLIGLVVSGIVIFGAVGIWKVVVSVAATF